MRWYNINELACNWKRYWSLTLLIPLTIKSVIFFARAKKLPLFMATEAVVQAVGKPPSINLEAKFAAESALK